MNLVTRFVISAVTSGLVACASQGPANAPVTPAAAPKNDTTSIPKGYRRVVRDGDELFCRYDNKTGSRTEKIEVCLTRAELQAEQSGDDSRTQQAHQNAGASIYSAPTSQTGKAAPK